MKKTLIILSVLVLINLIVFTVAIAQNTENGNQNRNEIQQREQERIQEEEQQNQDDLIIAPKGEQVRARTTNELRTMVQEKQQEMNQEVQSLEEKEQKVYQNQNEVRLAVHSLLAMEDLVGGIGPQVSEIAKDFDNSVQATIRAEESIQNRNMIVRFFAGGDQEAAGEIEREVNQNKIRVQQLKQLREQCDCDEEVKNMFQEQIQNMEQEQNRLQQLAEKEKHTKGIWGWIKSLFGR